MCTQEVWIYILTWKIHLPAQAFMLLAPQIGSEFLKNHFSLTCGVFACFRRQISPGAGDDAERGRLPWRGRLQSPGREWTFEGRQLRVRGLRKNLPADERVQGARQGQRLARVVQQTVSTALTLFTPFTIRHTPQPRQTATLISEGNNLVLQIGAFSSVWITRSEVH